MHELKLFSAKFFSSLFTLFLVYNNVFANDSEVKKHIELGNKLLMNGQFTDALHHYHEVIAKDPDNYQILYRRATVFLATGKVRAALPDLDRVIELKPDFIAGRIQRGNVLLKKGQLTDAENDFQYAIKSNSDHEEANEKLRTIHLLNNWIEEADDYLENKDYKNAEDLLSKAIEISEWNPDLHRKRAKCRQINNDIQGAITDIRSIAKLVPDSTDVFFEMSDLYYELGEIDNSLLQIRECLKLDPDHKKCFPFYKKIKKLVKLRKSLEEAHKNEKWADCLEKGQNIQKFEKNNDNVYFNVFRYTCKCNYKLGHSSEAIQECTEILNHVDENDLDALLNRGEAYIINEEYEKAVEDFKKAANAHESSKRAKEALDRGQKLLKRSKKKDYYKILGVKPGADNQEITKAYRKLARKTHPDRFQDPKEKERAQKEFIDIANAKDVLTNPEKRKMYDQGIDPLDPQSAHEGWHHSDDSPFGSHFGHGFPFGAGGGSSGGYTFKFHFG